MRIEYRDVSLRDGRNLTVSHFTYIIEPGRLGAMYGTRDSAKTLLLLAAAGLVRVASGDILLGDLSVKRDPARARKMVGVAASPTANPLISHLNVRDNLWLQARALRIKDLGQRIPELIAHFGLADVQHQYADELSELMVTKTGLAMALIADPAVILVDEPERRLTSEQTNEVLSELRRLKDIGKTVLITTRHRDVLSRCDEGIEVAYVKEVQQVEPVSANVPGTQTTSA